MAQTVTVHLMLRRLGNGGFLVARIADGATVFSPWSGAVQVY